MSRFKLPPPIIDIYVEKSLYRDKPKETVFHISPRPQTDLIENRLKQIKKYIQGIKETNERIMSLHNKDICVNKTPEYVQDNIIQT